MFPAASGGRPSSEAPAHRSRRSPDAPVSAPYAHDAEVADSLKAAQAIVPLICEMFGTPESVVDLGGGTGGWCRAFKECGTRRVVCIDHPSARSSPLLIDGGEFLPADLSRENVAPIPSALALAVEVAEHLPESRAGWIVEFLTTSAPLVVFSAAIPRQGGVRHVNEQFRWFWAKRFAERGFECWDCLRGRIVFDESIPYWHRQNLMVYADPSRLPRARAGKDFLPQDFELIHRDIARRLTQPPTLRTIVQSFIPSIIRSLRHRLRPGR
jgi:hypothetical protein